MSKFRRPIAAVTALMVPIAMGLFLYSSRGRAHLGPTSGSRPLTAASVAFELASGSAQQARFLMGGASGSTSDGPTSPEKGASAIGGASGIDFDRLISLITRRRYTQLGRALDSGADVNIADPMAMTLIQYCAKIGDIDAAQILLEHHADPNFASFQGGSAMLLAAMTGHWKMAVLMERYGGNIRQPNSEGFTTLDVALKEAPPKIVAALLRGDPGINVLEGSSAQPPLSTAIQFGRRDLIPVLVHMGANVNLPDGQNRTPLETAILERDPQAMEALRSFGSQVRTGPVFRAIAANNLAEADTFLRTHPGAANSPDRFLDYPIHQAILWGKPKMVSLILSHGADPTERSGSDETPVALAARLNMLEAVKMLVARGASVSERGRCGTHQDLLGVTPMHVAAHYGSLDVARYLISRGADVNAEDDSGDTPLHSAVEGNSLPTVELLLEHGAAVDAANEDGITPLDLAATRDLVPAARLLIQHHAALNRSDRLGQTPLHRAASFASTAMVQLLVRAGASTAIRDRMGRTPVQCAIFHGNTTAAAALGDARAANGHRSA